MSVRILIGDCRERLAELEAGSVDSCVCDPPYHLTSIVKRFGSANAAPVKLKKIPGQSGSPYARAAKGFMGQTWDGGDVAFDPATWEAVLRVLKPGAHLIAFSGTRTYHRMVCAIEDAGFEIRDQIGWAFGSGFPKSHNQPGGWGTALKPAWEPICLARKPLVGTVAANMAAHGTGGINIDGCRIAAGDDRSGGFGNGKRPWETGAVGNNTVAIAAGGLGRWPANIIHDGSEEVLQAFPDAPGQIVATRGDGDRTKNVYGEWQRQERAPPREDSGSAARFFYCAKATTAERGEGNNHPTVKPQALMRWLCRLVTPKGGLVLDPFAGSGSTLIAADQEGFRAVGVELSEEYAAIARRRLADDRGPLFAESAAA